MDGEEGDEAVAKNTAGAQGGQGTGFVIREQKEEVRVVRGDDCIQGLICE